MVIAIASLISTAASLTTALDCGSNFLARTAGKISKIFSSEKILENDENKKDSSYKLAKIHLEIAKLTETLETVSVGMNSINEERLKLQQTHNELLKEKNKLDREHYKKLSRHIKAQHEISLRDLEINIDRYNDIFSMTTEQVKADFSRNNGLLILIAPVAKGNLKEFSEFDREIDFKVSEIINPHYSGCGFSLGIECPETIIKRTINEIEARYIRDKMSEIGRPTIVIDSDILECEFLIRVTSPLGFFSGNQKQKDKPERAAHWHWKNVFKKLQEEGGTPEQSIEVIKRCMLSSHIGWQLLSLIFII